MIQDQDTDRSEGGCEVWEDIKVQLLLLLLLLKKYPTRMKGPDKASSTGRDI